jgi:hydroxyacylglutathione hydrolase
MAKGNQVAGERVGGKGNFRRCAAWETACSERAMKVHVLPTGPLQTNGYLLTAPERGEAVLVDAPLGVWDEVRELLQAERCALRELWLTHGHFDHIEGGADIIDAAKPLVRGHPADRAMFEQPEKMRWFIEMFLPGHPRMRPVPISEWLTGTDRFTALGVPVEVRHVPGHADGNVVFHIPALKSVFVGDSLFAGSIGRTDLPGGSFDVLSAAIRRELYTLPDDTVVYPGHGPRTTIGAEKRGNPYVHD